ncbi:ARF-binding protein [Microbotryomycetes sp. JL221]|nr:ARF-binding protein [Microbotryomycetes sp. JL221]
MSGSSSRRSAWSTGYGSTKETLIAFIDRACDPSMFEPNLSLNLEIAELINQKKANTPREAAVEVVKHVNSRNTHEAMLALHLLDILVKNCGYPFHLQISTKDFLNELVRRFPERPPTFHPPPMAKILELIHEWKNTLCVHSKHKEDLVHIRDMHRLLGYKGYRFPDFDKRAASSLQTPEELEEEDRAAQAAKLQELIRRGTPKDLAAAQELMKIMSGAEPEKKPDYEKQVDKELDRIQQRILLLNEMLNNAKPNERFVDGDAFDQIAQKCRHVQPKIQKWISESAENELGQVDRLLLMNDLINNVIKRYESFKAGDRTATAEIDPALQSGKPATKRKNEPASLIDFDDEPAPVTNQTSSNPMDDLAALGSLSLEGPSSTTNYANNNATTTTKPQRVDPMSFFNSTPSNGFNQSGSNSNNNNNNNNNNTYGSGGSFFSNPTYNNTFNSNQASGSGSNSPSINWSNAPNPTTTTTTTGGISTTSSPSVGAIHLGTNSTMSRPTSAASSNSPLPALPLMPQQQQQQRTNNVPQPPPKKKDAFEDLLGDF